MFFVENWKQAKSPKKKMEAPVIHYSNAAS